MRIYVEGGGDGSHTKRQVRQGFEAFFHEFEGARPKIIAHAGAQTTKRGYNEIRDCPRILKMVSPATVRHKCPHCLALFAALRHNLGRNPAV